MDINCEICGKSFSNIYNLKRHKNNVDHSITKDFKFQCSVCSRHFNKKYHLKFHLKHDHNNYSTTHQYKNQFQCPLCSSKQPTKDHCIKHFEVRHEIRIEYERINLENAEEFVKWKNKIENDTKTRFVKKKSFESKSQQTTIYSCHRSGYFVSSGTGKRHLKTQGSDKINAFCPANIRVVKKKGTDSHNVTFLKTHVGHNADLGHLVLTSTEREALASKIASRISFDSILDEVRDSVGSGLERIHLLTKKDLYNIESSFNLNSSAVRHKDDGLSVDAWAKEMQEAGTVLYYKPQDKLDDNHQFLKREDFVLVIMTAAQSELLLKYGSDCVCIDGTHGLNGYGFELNTVMILDELRQGFPCAFIITNRSDKETFCLFFSYIKQKIGTMSTNIFMSDMADAFYNAWVQIMGLPTNRLFCTWHVDRAWRKNLTKIEGKEKQAEVYKQLRIVLEETDKVTFHRMLQQFKLNLEKDSATHSFLKYFKDYYEPKYETWAYSYRVHLGINTNMHVERMHKTLKYIYLNGKHIKRLDKAINIIMKFVRDKLYDQLIIAHKGKICSKIKDMRKRHLGSLNLDISQIVEVENGWNVPSSSNKLNIYHIEENIRNCNCHLVCTDCEICIHKFKCSCLDSTIKWNICKHIHLLARYQKTQEATVSMSDRIELSPQALTINDEEEDNCHIRNSILNEISHDNLKRKQGNEEDLKIKKIKLIAQFTELVNKVSTEEQLAVLQKAITPIPHIFESMETHFTIKKQGDNIPHNKGIQKQRLYSTRKKTGSTSKTKSLKNPDEMVL